MLLAQCFDWSVLQPLSNVYSMKIRIFFSDEKKKNPKLHWVYKKVQLFKQYEVRSKSIETDTLNFLNFKILRF